MSDMYSCLNRRLPRRCSPNCLTSLITGWRLPLWPHGTLTDLENQLVSIRYYQNIYQYKELHSVLYYDLFDRTWKYWIEKGWGIYHGTLTDLENQLVSIRYYQNIYQYKELHSVLYYDLFDRTWKYWIEKGWGIYAMGSIADKPPSIWHEYNFLKFQRKMNTCDMT